MVAIPIIHKADRPMRSIGGPLHIDREFADFLAARRSGRILSRDEWIARHHNRPSLLARLLGKI
jgi:hypothetical protein